MTECDRRDSQAFYQQVSDAVPVRYPIGDRSRSRLETNSNSRVPDRICIRSSGVSITVADQATSPNLEDP